MRKIKENKGFTLAELLIVVAIIGVLVAISIPIFTKQLEKAREATDLANARSAYAQVMVLALDDDATAETKTIDGVEYTTTATKGSRTVKAVVTLKQKQADWQTANAGTAVAGITSTGTPTVGGHCTIEWSEATNATTIVYN